MKIERVQYYYLLSLGVLLGLFTVTSLLATGLILYVGWSSVGWTCLVYAVISALMSYLFIGEALAKKQDLLDPPPPPSEVIIPNKSRSSHEDS